MLIKLTLLSKTTTNCQVGDMFRFPPPGRFIRSVRNNPKKDYLRALRPLRFARAM
ncbi:hypothetical protein [Bacteriophage sp.]|nr:hypothetical protein [Bacteriophage sp.]